MSGLGIGGGRPYISEPNDNTTCANLVFNTNLASPQAHVIDTLEVGVLLRIRVLSDQGPIQAITQDNSVAGTIVSSQQVRLLTCINRGTRFIAEVMSLNNGQCTIKIEAI